MQTANKIRERLKQDKKLLQFVILEMLERQTDDEIQERITKHYNRMGFNISDAPELTAFALTVKEFNALPDSEELIDMVTHRISKYARQISEILSEAKQYKKHNSIIMHVDCSKFKEKYFENLNKIKQMRYEKAVRDAVLTYNKQAFLGHGSIEVKLVTPSRVLSRELKVFFSFDPKRKIFYAPAGFSVLRDHLVAIFGEEKLKGLPDSVFSDRDIFDVLVEDDKLVIYIPTAFKKLKHKIKKHYYHYYRKLLKKEINIKTETRYGKWGEYEVYIASLDKAKKIINTDMFTEASRKQLISYLQKLEEKEKEYKMLVKTDDPNIIFTVKDYNPNYFNIKINCVENKIAKQFMAFMELNVSSNNYFRFASCDKTTMYGINKKKKILKQLSELDFFSQEQKSIFKNFLKEICASYIKT